MKYAEHVCANLVISVLSSCFECSIHLEGQRACVLHQTEFKDLVAAKALCLKALCSFWIAFVGKISD